MTKENFFDLYKDLCSRLPYGVVCKMWFAGKPETSIVETLKFGGISDFFCHEIEVMPYLRPMSSMTEDEKLELVTLYLARDKRCRKDLRIKETEFFLDSCWYVQIVYKDENDKEVISAVYIGRGSYIEEIDWLNAHHFDYRGLIKKGLALEAPEGMY